jgi:hypothetical protein
LLIRLSDTAAIRRSEMPTYVAPIERLQRWRQREGGIGGVAVGRSSGTVRT